MVFMENIT
jgi:hypothetical protein